MNLTDEQAKCLTSEQQVLIASLEMKRVEQRARLLDEARKYRVPWFAALWFPSLIPLACLLMYFTERIYLVLFICFVAFGLQAVISSEIKSVNRRIDALIEWLETDEKRPEA